MKIAHIVASLEPRHGGPSVSVPALAGATAQAGHSVELLAAGPESSTASSTGSLVRRVFRRSPPEILGRSRELAAHLKGFAGDVLHSHGLWLRTLHYADRAARRSGALHVISPRGMMADWAWNHRRWQKSLAGALLHPGALEAAHGWHATSESERAEIRARGFRQPVCVAPNGVALPDESARIPARQYWERRSPVFSGPRVALFYSRLHDKKRVQELIELWSAEDRGNWRLAVVGIPDGHTVAALQSRADALGSGGNIQVFDGTGAPPPYAAASLLLLPSHNENFGLVIAEALAHGVPVLTTDATPWSGLGEKSAGWCVPWSDFPAVLRSALAETPDALARRGANGRHWVAADFSWDRSARLLADFYEALRLARQPVR